MRRAEIASWFLALLCAFAVGYWFKDPIVHRSPLEYWVSNPEDYGECIQATGEADLSRRHILDPAVPGTECSFRWGFYTQPVQELH
jgi:hypothetical protein